MALTDVPQNQLLAAIHDGEESSALELVNFASSKDAAIRAGVAARADVPISAMIVLAQDGKSQVRLALAGNPSVARAISVLGMLASDKDNDVTLALASNRSVPIETLRELAKNGKKRARQRAQERLATEF